MIRCRCYLGIIGLLLVVLAGLGGWSHSAAQKFMADQLPARRQLVHSLSLTDLSLWTEARYTRHPAMADLFSPFQDLPGGFDHFPAGSLLAPAGPKPDTTLRVQRRGTP